MVLIIRTTANTNEHRVNILKESDFANPALVFDTDSQFGLYVNNAANRVGFSQGNHLIFEAGADTVTLQSNTIVVEGVTVADSINSMLEGTISNVSGNYNFIDKAYLTNRYMIPTVTNVVFSTSEFQGTGQEAVNTSKGHLIILGSEFEMGAVCMVDSIAQNTIFINSETLHVETSNLQPGFSDLQIVSPYSMVSSPVQIPVSDGPKFVTDTLPQIMSNVDFSIQIQALSDSTCTFSATSPPPGVGLSSDGVLSGRTPPSGDIIYSIPIRVTDQEKQYFETEFMLRAVQFLRGSKVPFTRFFNPWGVFLSPNQRTVAVAYPGAVVFYVYGANFSWSVSHTLTPSIGGFGKSVFFASDQQVAVVSDVGVHFYSIETTSIKLQKTVSLPNSIIDLHEDILVQYTSNDVVLYRRNAVGNYVREKSISLSGELANVTVSKVFAFESFLCISTTSGTVYRILYNLEDVKKYVHSSSSDGFGGSVAFFGGKICISAPQTNAVFLFDTELNLLDVLSSDDVFSLRARDGVLSASSSTKVQLFDTAFNSIGSFPRSRRSFTAIGSDILAMFDVFSIEPTGQFVGDIFVKNFISGDFSLDQ